MKDRTPVQAHYFPLPLGLPQIYNFSDLEGLGILRQAFWASWQVEKGMLKAEGYPDTMKFPFLPLDHFDQVEYQVYRNKSFPLASLKLLKKVTKKKRKSQSYL